MYVILTKIWKALLNDCPTSIMKGLTSTPETYLIQLNDSMGVQTKIDNSAEHIPHIAS